MTVEAILIDTQVAKYSENIINSYMTFNDLFTYDFTDGVGNATVENSDEKSLIGTRAMKVRALNNSPCTFNAQDRSDTTIKTTGIHFIQFQAFKLDPSADITITLKVYVNGYLDSDRTFPANLYSSSGFVDGAWNIYYQSFLANQGDIVSLAWTFQSDTTDAIMYLDAFKIEANEQSLAAPTIYTNPTFLSTKWTRVYDFTNTQLLFDGVAFPFAFEGTTETNCGTEILIPGYAFKPSRLNSFFTVNGNFLAQCTSTATVIEANLRIYGITYSGLTTFLQKPTGEYQYINIVFNIPSNQEFLDSEGVIELTAIGDDIDISRRVITVSEQLNQN